VDPAIEQIVKHQMHSVSLTNLECLKSILGVQKICTPMDGIAKDIKAEVVWAMVKRLEAEGKIEKGEKVLKKE